MSSSLSITARQTENYKEETSELYSKHIQIYYIEIQQLLIAIIFMYFKECMEYTILYKCIAFHS